MADEGGWTLIELVVVIGILGVLIAIAVPSYLGYTSRATARTAQYNLLQALPAVESYHVDNATYVGLGDPVDGMRKYNPGISSGVAVNDPADLTVDHYCLKSTYRSVTFWVRGPGGAITDTKPSGCT